MSDLMSRSITAALLGAALAVSAPMAHAEKLTPERVFSDPDLNGPQARGVKLSPDGELVTYLKSRPEDQNALDLWAAPVKGGEPFRLIDSKALAPDEKTLSEAEKARRERQRISQHGVVEYDWDDQGRFILVPLDGDLWLAERATGKARRLTQTPGDEIDGKVSPKGDFVSYVRDQNLYVMDLATGQERALTTDGKGTLSWAVAEFVAQEEMGRFTGYWWSPDERRIALTRVDESGVDVIPRLDIGAQGVKVIEQRYPRAGRPNAVVELYVEDLATGSKVKVDLGPDTDIYLARAAWSKDGKTLYVQRQTRDQKRLDLLAVDPATGAARVILTETSPQWVELNDAFKPLANGDFLWASERSGYNHLYLYDRDGKLIRQVTDGAWPVAKVQGVDEARGVVLFTASKDTPIEQQLYSVSYRTPEQPHRLTTGAGWWDATVARKGGAFVGTFSDPSTPPRTALYGADGQFVRWIEPNTLDATHPYFKYLDHHRTPTFGTIKAADGEDLHYSMLTPPGFDPARKYPVIVAVYGGPHVQTVQKRWGALTDQLLLEEGYIVFHLDNRGSSNRSVGFKTANYHRLGTVETEDQLAGVGYLQSLPYVDPARIGVMGWSYGGFMTLTLLTAQDTPFAAGAAGAPPTDWQLYDTHYTEQFMGRPQENPDGYAQSDLIPRLDRLKPGSLLLMQGMADDNVIFENTTRVMAALQAKSIPFELMDYPGERHGIRGNGKKLHLFRTQMDFLNRKLKPGT
jgi:dipeptidyl-peptidase-4